MITLRVDRTKCQGYGNCVLASATHFDVDDDGLVVLVAETADDGAVAAVRRAAYDCPTEAITLLEGAAQ